MKGQKGKAKGKSSDKEIQKTREAIAELQRKLAGMLERKRKKQ